MDTKEYSIATCCKDGIKTWRLYLSESSPKHNSYKPLASFNNHSRHTAIKCVKWNTRNDEVFSCAADGRVISNRAALGEYNKTVYDCKTELTAIDLSYGSRYLAVAGFTNRIDVIDLATGDIVSTFTKHDQPITTLAFDVTGYRIVSGDVRGNLYVHYVVHGDARYSPLPADSRKELTTVKNIRCSPHNEYLAASAHLDGSVHLWNIQKYTQLHVFKAHEASCTAVCFSPLNGKLLFSCGIDRRAVFYDANQEINEKGEAAVPKVIRRFDLPHELTCASFLEDAKNIAVSARNGTVYILNLISADKEQIVHLAMEAIHSSEVVHVQFQAHKPKLACQPDYTPILVNMRGQGTGQGGQATVQTVQAVTVQGAVQATPHVTTTTTYVQEVPRPSGPFVSPPKSYAQPASARGHDLKPLPESNLQETSFEYQQERERLPSVTLSERAVSPASSIGSISRSVHTVVRAPERVPSRQSQAPESMSPSPQKGLSSPVKPESHAAPPPPPQPRIATYRPASATPELYVPADASPTESLGSIITEQVLEERRRSDNANVARHLTAPIAVPPSRSTIETQTDPQAQPVVHHGVSLTADDIRAIVREECAALRREIYDTLGEDVRRLHFELIRQGSSVECSIDMLRDKLETFEQNLDRSPPGL